MVRVYVILALIVALFGGGFGLYGKLETERAAHAEEVGKLNLKISTNKLEYANAAYDLSEKYRRLEKQYSNDVEAERMATAKAKADAAAALSNLRATDSRLSKDLAGYLTTHRDRALAATPAGEREAADLALSVYAELLSRSRRRNVELVEFADAAYTSGKGCERTYEVTK